MTFIGKVRDGRIVLSGDPSLPEGAEVRVEVVEAIKPVPVLTVRPKPVDKLAEMLLQVAGKVSRLPQEPSQKADSNVVESEAESL